MKKKHRKTKRHYNGVNGRKRVNSSGTLEQRPGRDGWIARWFITNALGKRIRKSKFIPRSQEVPDVETARQRLNDLTRENGYNNLETALLKTQDQLIGVRNERSKFLDGLPALKIEDMWEAFSKTRAGKRPSESTLIMYECQVGRFIRFMRERFPNVVELRRVNYSMAQAFSEYLSTKFSANTHNKYLILLASVWNAIKEKEREEMDGVSESASVTELNTPKTARLASNPFEGIRVFEIATFSRRELTIAEIRTIVNSVEGEMKLLFCIGLETGLRLGDAVLLDWSKIDMDRGFIRLRPRKVERKMVKENRWITLPILPDLYNMLSKISVEDRHGYVVPHLAEEYSHSTSCFSMKLGKIFRVCGIETTVESEIGRSHVLVGYHSLRHTFVSIAARYGVPMATIQALVGHATVKMTEHYTHISRETLKEQMQSFPRLLSGGDGGETAVKTEGGAS